MWVLAATHIIRLRHDPHAEWESFWGSTAFEIADRRDK
jgi:hypothetical protein